MKLLTHHAQEVASGLNTTKNIQKEALKRFKEECEFLKSLSHDNIVRHYYTYIDPKSNLPMLIMELMECSLKQYLQEKQGCGLPLNYQTSMCLDIAKALEHLHLKNIIHRDLCDANVLLNLIDDVPRVKIADFGMSRIFKCDYLSATLTAIGHREVYFPREAREDPYHYSCTVDIYSFGVIATQIILLKINLKTKAELVAMVITIPQNHVLKSAISKCLEEDRHRRPTAADLVNLISVNSDSRAMTQISEMTPL